MNKVMTQNWHVRSRTRWLRVSVRSICQRKKFLWRKIRRYRRNWIIFSLRSIKTSWWLWMLKLEGGKIVKSSKKWSMLLIRTEAAWVDWIRRIKKLILVKFYHNIKLITSHVHQQRSMQIMSFQTKKALLNALMKLFSSSIPQHITKMSWLEANFRVMTNRQNCKMRIICNKVMPKICFTSKNHINWISYSIKDLP